MIMEYHLFRCVGVHGGKGQFSKRLPYFWHITKLIHKLLSINFHQDILLIVVPAAKGCLSLKYFSLYRVAI